ncbi:MAG: hypothetical protein Q9222_000712 [Ikaeria aurantiellina]
MWVQYTDGYVKMSFDELPSTEYRLLLHPENTHFAHTQADNDAARTWLIRLLPRWRINGLASGAMCFLIALLPSFIHPRRADTEPNKERISARNNMPFLDGLRGAAALTVFNYHFAHGTYAQSMDRMYGAEGHNKHFFQLPVIRVLYAAEASVAIFCVLSGYVLSRRLLTRERANAVPSILALALQRELRLFAPAVAASLLPYLAQRCGWMPVKGLPEEYVRNLQNDTRMYLAYLCTLLNVMTWEIDLSAGE